MNLISLLCFTVFYFEEKVLGYTISQEENLHDALMSGYRTDMRPGIDRSNGFNVTISFYLFYITGFDLNTGKLMVNGALKIRWEDHRLKWDPASYGSMTYTSISENKMWLPNLILTNSYEEIENIASFHQTVQVNHTGHCTWFPIRTYEVICDTDVTRYPFDTQYCALHFLIWGYNPEEYNVIFEDSKVRLELYSENGIWEFKDSKTFLKKNAYNFNEIIIGFYLKRRTTYYTSCLLLPITAISMLMGFVFLLPSDCGERLGFSTTVLLSIVVYLTVIQGMLPEASEPSISVLGYVLVTYIMSGAISVILVIISIRIQSTPDTKPVPHLTTGLIIFCRCKNKVNSKSEETLDSKFITKETADVEDEMTVTWTEVGKTFDMACFLLSGLQFTVSLIIYLSYVYS